MIKKNFDCVELQHKGGQYVKSLIAGMTPDEELKFWDKETKRIQKKQATLKRKTHLTFPSST